MQSQLKSEFHNPLQNFDGSSIGDTFTEALLNSSGPKTSLSWEVVDAKNFPNGASDLVAAVVDERAWVIVSSEYISQIQAHLFIQN